jgi:VWFA-related protein
MSKLRLLPKFALSLLLCVSVVPSLAQQAREQPSPQPPDAQDDDTVRINTELIQTGVTVFDKQGRFVDKLKLDDFELRVDGKPLSPSFFERIVTGLKPPDTLAPRAAAGALDARLGNVNPQGRIVIFLIDDVHLSPSSHKIARDLVQHYIEKQMTIDDRVVVVSTTGKIGFLQQFTDNKAVLRAAIARLNYSRDRTARNNGYPEMGEYQALMIDRYDHDITYAFAAALVKEGLALDLEDGIMQARSRSRDVLQVAAINSKATLSTFESAVRNSAGLQGRKIIFFVSDGFLMDQANTDVPARLRHITDAASRTNAVVYSIDARGLDTAQPDAGTGGAYGPALRNSMGELLETQDPLNSIAESTGGRFVHNTNGLNIALDKALDETATYYLLAWRPDSGNGGPEKFRRIEVNVKGRPELKVRVQKGFLDEQPKSPDKAAKIAGAPVSVPEQQLRSAVGSILPLHTLPTSLVLSYVEDAAEGAVLSASIQIKSEAVDFAPVADKATGEVDLVGVVYNANGKREASFKDRLTLKVPISTVAGDMFRNIRTKLGSGLFQVRVAARDVKSGHTGSAIQWIDIPDLSTRKLALSSLLVGERRVIAQQQHSTANETELRDVEISVDRRFQNTSRLRYLLYVYNAAVAGNGKSVPDVAVRTEVLRNNIAVMQTPASSISTTGQDPVRLAYAAEVPLNTLTPGRYVLQVTVVDRNSKNNPTVTQSVVFEVK